MTGPLRPEQIDDTFAPAHRSTVASLELDGEMVVYDEASGTIHRLSCTGSIVWACFDGSSSLAEVIEDLAVAFGVAPGDLRDDVVGLTRELGRLGLLEGMEADEPAGGPTADHDHAH